MTIPVSREAVTYGGSDGALATGLARQVISGVGATRTLLTKESGALCLFDSAAGAIYTLPAITANNIGMTFEFLVTVAVTSNAHKIITADAATFLVGGTLAGELAAAMDYFQADGSTIRAVNATGSTLGGLIGETYKVTAISLTAWGITGIQVGSGTLATPFATS